MIFNPKIKTVRFQQASFFIIPDFQKLSEVLINVDYYKRFILTFNSHYLCSDRNMSESKLHVKSKTDKSASFICHLTFLKEQRDADKRG